MVLALASIPAPSRAVQPLLTRHAVACGASTAKACLPVRAVLHAPVELPAPPAFDLAPQFVRFADRVDAFFRDVVRAGDGTGLHAPPR